MAILGETAKSSAQNAFYDSLKIAVGWVFGRFVEPVLTGQAKAMSVPAATAWGFLASALLIFLGVWIWDAWQAKRALPRRRVRILEHYGIHLQWVRAIAIRPEATKAQLDDAAKFLRNDRGDLMNYTPSVFSQATADAFRQPDVISVLDARKVVEGLEHQSLRESILAHTDHLLRAVASKWQAYGGQGQEP